MARMPTCCTSIQLGTRRHAKLLKCDLQTHPTSLEGNFGKRSAEIVVPDAHLSQAGHAIHDAQVAIHAIMIQVQNLGKRTDLAVTCNLHDLPGGQKTNIFDELRDNRMDIFWQRQYTYTATLGETGAASSALPGMHSGVMRGGQAGRYQQYNSVNQTLTRQVLAQCRRRLSGGGQGGRESSGAHE